MPRLYRKKSLIALADKPSEASDRDKRFGRENSAKPRFRSLPAEGNILRLLQLRGGLHALEVVLHIIAAFLYTMSHNTACNSGQTLQLAVNTGSSALYQESSFARDPTAGIMEEEAVMRCKASLGDNLSGRCESAILGEAHTNRLSEGATLPDLDSQVTWVVRFGPSDKANPKASVSSRILGTRLLMSSF